MKLTSKQGFYAMFYLLDAYFDNGYEGDLGGLLGSMNPFLFDGEMPADLATYDDWKSCIDELNGGKCESLDVDMAYNAIIKFLEFYSTKFAFDFRVIINDMKSHRICDESVDEIWSQCVENALRNQ